MESFRSLFVVVGKLLGFFSASCTVYSYSIPSDEQYVRKIIKIMKKEQLMRIQRLFM